MCDGSARGWLAGWWAWSKWACTGAAQRLALHGGRGRWAGAAGKITEALTGGFEWGRSSTVLSA